MAFQPINYAGIQPQGFKPAGNFADLMKKGLQLGMMPEQFQQQQQMNEFKKRLMESQIQKNKRNDPSWSGDIGQIMQAERIKQMFGEGSEQYNRAKAMLDMNQKKAEQLNKYREALTGAAPKRGVSSVGKLEFDLRDAQAGYVPGTNRTQALDPNDQRDLVNALLAAREKQSSDTSTRQKSLYAKNIDKTMARIDPDVLTQYSGLLGGLEKAGGYAFDTDAYEKFQKNLVDAKILSDQIQQFYGQSIQPEVTKKIEMITNPSAWATSPKIAKQKFLELKDLLKNETETYTGSVGGPIVAKRAEGGKKRVNYKDYF